MGFEGNTYEIWTDLDVDGNGKITLDEIDSEANDLWDSARCLRATRGTASP